MLTAAAAYTPLNTLLGTSPFRWYYDTLQQGSAYPAIVVTQISGNKTYSVTARLKTGFSRYQFTIWGGQYAAGALARDTVEDALASFLDQWSGGIGIAGLAQYPNRIVGEREFLYTEKDTPVYQKVVDAILFSNDAL